jgi:hypothetical protein
MSISSSPSSFPLTKGLYPKLGGALPLYSTAKPISSVFFHSRLAPSAFQHVFKSHQFISALKHDKKPRVLISELLPSRLVYSPCLPKRSFYSKKVNDPLQQETSRLFRELKAELKDIEAEANTKADRFDAKLKIEIKRIESKLKKIPNEVKSEIGKKEHENFKKFYNKNLAYVKGMTPFDWAKKVGAPITAFAIYFFRAQISDYIKKIFKKETAHIDITAENLLRVEDAFKSQEGSIKKVAIIGIAGSGRTHLAKQYVEHYEQNMRGQSDSIRTVFLGDGRDFGTFVQLYTKFAEDLGVKVPLDASQEVIIKEVNKKLAERPHWLFVIDNVEACIYEKLQAYFPNASKGKILLVAQENLKGVLSFDIQENMACQDEALKIFNFNLGEKHWAFQLANSSKRELARQLFYLPLAIKQAAIHLREENQKNDKQAESFISSISFYIDTLKSIAKKDNKDSSPGLDADMLLKAIFSLEIEKCEIKIRESEIIFSIIPFLCPIFVDESLLKSWFVNKGGKTELFAPILDLLEKSSLITLKEQNKWEIHPYLHKVLIDKASKEEKKSEAFFKEFVFFLAEKYGLDMRFVDGYNLNKSLVNLLEPLSKHAERLGLKDELNYCFVHLYNVLANYHLQSNNFFEAQKAFKESLRLAGIEPEKQTAENLYQRMRDLNILRNDNFHVRNSVNIWQTFKKNLNLARIWPINQTSITLLHIIDELDKPDKKKELSKKDLLALCAQSIHYLGKIYFHTRDLNQAKNYFEKALYLHKKVITYPALHGNPNPFDIITFQRQGIGWALLEGNKEDLKEAKNLYLKLFDEKKFTREGQKIDESNEWYCNLQLGRVYLKLAQATSDKEDKKKYYYKAQERLEKGGIKNEIAFRGALQMLKKDHLKAGEVCLMLGELYLDRSNTFKDLDKDEYLNKAQEYFENALQMSKADYMIGAKSKYYLARLYLEKGLFHQAYKAITESIQLFNKIGGKGLTKIVPKGFYEAEKIKEAFKNEAHLIS